MGERWCGSSQAITPAFEMFSLNFNACSRVEKSTTEYSGTRIISASYGKVLDSRKQWITCILFGCGNCCLNHKQVSLNLEGKISSTKILDLRNVIENSSTIAVVRDKVGTANE